MWKNLNVTETIIGPEDLKRARKLSGLTQARFARLFKVNPHTIWMWENNRSAPQPRYVRQLAQVIQKLKSEGLWMEDKRPDAVV